jgi:hypothetical protein
LICSLRRLSGGLCATLALSALAVALSASSARAAVVDVRACDSSPLTQPFAQWADPAFYKLAPGGDFETSAWALSDGARLAPGSEPFGATGHVGSSALSLSAGASAQSPSTCVNAAYPTIRFFVGGTGTVAVQVIYDGTTISSGFVAATGDWSPTPVMLTGSAIAGAANGGTAQVSLRLVATSGNPQVDDVFIDPWQRG